MTNKGLYCSAGEFYIDPWRPVEHAIVTHAHADHARAGSQNYYAATSGIELLKHRLGIKDHRFLPKDYGEVFYFKSTRVSLHPAGHILGSSQVRVEHNGEVWVFTGDFKRDEDPSCEPFEVVPCGTFITESTFGLPVYQWRPTSEVAQEILDWWRECKETEKTAFLFCYSLGKAQRILAELGKLTNEEVLLHDTMIVLTQIYRDQNIALVPHRPLSSMKGEKLSGQLILAPPATYGSSFMNKVPNHSVGFASGWMQIRGNRRRRGYDRGFVISDHADWHSLIRTIQETGAKKIYVTHGEGEILSQYLRELNYDAEPLKTEFEGEKTQA